MCLILLAYQTNTRWPLVIAANRDEFYSRPSLAAHFWDNQPVLAGRDLEAGGTWLGISKTGRFAAVTNYRNPSSQSATTRSRGELVSQFLSDSVSALNFAENVVAKGSEYQGFNLLLNDGDHFVYCNNFENTVHTLEPGLYGLSNHALDTPWPKVTRGKTLLKSSLNSAVGTEPHLHQTLLSIMNNREQPAERHLPDTGINKEWEKKLAPLFIEAGHYGTCCSTILTSDQQGKIVFTEKRYYPEEMIASRDEKSLAQFEFLLES